LGWVALYLIVGLLRLPSSAATLNANGEITYESVDLKDGRSLYSITRSFSAKITPNRWMIRTERNPNSTDGLTNLLATECWFDDSLMQLLTYWSPEPAGLARKPIRYLGRTRIQAHLYPETVPRFDMNLHFPIWLAYASASYFKNQDGLIPDITVLLAPPDTNFPFVGFTAVFRNLMGYSIPEEVTFTNIGKYKSLQTGATVSYAAPYDKGFLNARYRVTSWTNYSSTERPYQAELELFVPVARGNGSPPISGLRPFTRVTISSHKVEVLDNEFPKWSPPALGGQLILVEDHRTIIEGKPLKYIGTNGIFLPTDPRYSQMVMRVRAGEQSMKLKHGERSIRLKVILLLFAGTVTFPFLLYWKRKSHTTTKIKP